MLWSLLNPCRILYYHWCVVCSSTVVPDITHKNEDVAKLNPKGLMGLTAWVNLEDIIYYDDCIMLELLEI